MNKERLLQLANVLESDKAAKHFNMDFFFSHDGYVQPSVPVSINKELEGHCGSVACIAGWTVGHFHPDGILFPFEISQQAAWLLGLDNIQKIKLFTPGVPESNEFDPYKASAKQAAKVVRHLAETGEVDWSKAFD